MTERSSSARPQAVATLLADDARTRVTRFDFAAGAETGWHRHEMDYVIIALTDLQMRLDLPAGETSEARIAAGSSYTRAAGVEHNVINVGGTAMSFVEVELK